MIPLSAPEIQSSSWQLFLHCWLKGLWVKEPVIPLTSSSWLLPRIIIISAQLLSWVPLFVTPWTVAQQAPLSMGFSRQECWMELPCPPPGHRPWIKKTTDLDYMDYGLVPWNTLRLNALWCQRTHYTSLNFSFSTEDNLIVYVFVCVCTCTHVYNVLCRKAAALKIRKSQIYLWLYP